MVKEYGNDLVLGTTELRWSLGKYKYIKALLVFATLRNLTLPDQFSIPFPNPTGGTHPSLNGGHLTPIPTPR